MAIIDLDETEQAFIEEQVQAGSYKNADDVVRAGLKLLRKQEAKIAELRALIQEGEDDFAAGRFVEFHSPGDLTAHIMRLEAEKR